MSPCAMIWTSCRGSFPRVSGDEPGISRALGIEEAFSPRERG